MYIRMDTIVHLCLKKTRRYVMLNVWRHRAIQVRVETVVFSKHKTSLFCQRLLLIIVFSEYHCLLRPSLPSLSQCFCFGCASTGSFFKHKQTYHNVLAGLLWIDCLHKLKWITNTGRKMFTFAHFCFLSTSIWLLNFWLSLIATDYEYKSPVFKTKIAEDRLALTYLCKSSYSMDVTLLLRLN